MATAKKSPAKKPVKKTTAKKTVKAKASSSTNGLEQYTTFERAGVILFMMLAISFLFLALAKFM